jgi:hypothetical protein
MEDKRCPVFVDGKECGFPLMPVDLEAEKIGSDLATYECGLGHRSYFLREPKTKSQTLRHDRRRVKKNGWDES